MKISKQARTDAKHLFRSCLIDGLMDEARVPQAVQQMIDRKPRGYVAVLSHFQRLVKMELQRKTAQVESAVALAEPMRAAIQENLTRIYGAGLTWSFTQNPSLVAGLRIRVGSDVYDGSIQSRLAELRDSFV